MLTETETDELFSPLHHMSELLGLRQPVVDTAAAGARDMPSSSVIHSKLVKANFHGSIMTVRKSKNPCLIELSRITIHETENAFKVIAPANKAKLVLYWILPADHNPRTTLPIPPTTEDIPLLQMILQFPRIEFGSDWYPS
ncbi:hypothetical protein BDN72DRAFT_862627 [Pluteus cervinus]|uniref:Uncharacterized protein n=1 Tax=Pluteus cervinus TaxID=181527 RepID=A0ACD3AAI1_9AGAR|nr:hypothetical protein BDN72DRAFT_862627 [Pluteus cervinus]